MLKKEAVERYLRSRDGSGWEYPRRYVVQEQIFIYRRVWKPEPISIVTEVQSKASLAAFLEFGGGIAVLFERCGSCFFPAMFRHLKRPAAVAGAAQA